MLVKLGYKDTEDNMNLITNNNRKRMTYIEKYGFFGQKLYSPKVKDIYQDKEIKIRFSSADISENDILEQMPSILNMLLIDRTTSTPKKPRNIIWANENYIKYGRCYGASYQIKPKSITGHMKHIIIPRALKLQYVQKERTKSKAEVFTPTWIVKKQNDVIDASYREDGLQTYINRKWLEVTCGEAPYMATRYDMETGNIVPLSERVGFVDRKLARINTEINKESEWHQLVEQAYKASYGFEWNGDSLLLARENLLFTYYDYHVAKWQDKPTYEHLATIANIISYNLFQMDGLKYIIPLSDIRKRPVKSQLKLFDENAVNGEDQKKSGKRVRIMDWDKNKMELFDKGLR